MSEQPEGVERFEGLLKIVGPKPWRGRPRCALAGLWRSSVVGRSTRANIFKSQNSSGTIISFSTLSSRCNDC